MKIVKVNLGPRSYPIYIGNDIIDNLASLVTLNLRDTPIFVVTNRKIKSLYGADFAKALRPLSKNILFHVVPDSERAKSFPVYIRTIRKLARFARSMKPMVCALGGGVIGDLTGFVASAYRRGVPYIQVPTTLLAQVDSAIGGKVAIDTKEAKNIVGNFYQPKMVVSDLRFLKTIPLKEMRNGLVEIIKYGIIQDRQLFSFLEKNIEKILKRDTDALEHIIYRSCSIKARVVENDEFDTKDIRAVLNFGHTLGHAIEVASGYSRSITHGQAVGIGTIMACLIALELKMITKSEYERICRLVSAVSPKPRTKHIKIRKVLDALSYDKKFIYGDNRFILPRGIGHVSIVDKVPHPMIRRVVEITI